MKRLLKILLVIGLLLAAMLFALLVAQRPSPPASVPIVLPDGSWARIEAVTYGTNHLVGPRLAHVANRMPQAMQNFMHRYLGRSAAMRFSYTTSSPKLVLWLNRGMATAFPTNIGYLECVLSTTNGATSGDVVSYAAYYPLETKEFTVFPRREREIVLSIYYHDAAGAVFKRGSVAFENPVYRRYPEWKPEPLPTTKRAGDVEVTLEKVSTRLDTKIGWENSPHGHTLVFTTNVLDGTSATVCALRLHATKNTNEIWRASGVATSDATGNCIRHETFTTDNETGCVVFFPTLWTNEPAWKLDFEITRETGFSPEELFTFRDVPLGALNATNRIGSTMNCNGVQVTLEQTARRERPRNLDYWTPDSEFELRLGVSGLTNDLLLDLISATTDAGPELGRYYLQSDGETNQIHHFNPPPPSAKSASFTFAVQKSRRVEFTVKPETGTVRLEVAPKNKP